MKQLQLSDRLLAIAEMVSPGNRIADIGCDHGYIPIYLYMAGKIPHAIAMDVNQGPLLRASEHIREYGLEEYIETRLSDGAAALNPREADSVIIAGMGGPLMEKILFQGEEVFAAVEELILQPQSEIEKFRRFLHSHNYRVIQEDMVLEEGKYYPMMKVVHGPQKYCRNIDYRYGYHLLREKHPVLKKFLEKEMDSLGKIKERLKTAGTDTAGERLCQVEQEIKLVKEALEACEM